MPAVDIPPTLIIGGDSFIGRHLVAAYRLVHADTLGTTRRREAKGPMAFLDLENPDFSSLPLGTIRAAIIAAAVSRVETCERQPEESRRVNVVGTTRLIEQLLARDILPIFLSSDYVFDGDTVIGNAEVAPLCPRTEYGRQKAEVEDFLRRSGRPYLVMRLSKNYGLHKGDGSFLDEIAGRLAAGQTYAAAHDQIFCPTCVEDLPPAIMKAQATGLRGVLNCCAPWPWSRYDICLAVARHLGLPQDLVRRISLDELPGNFARPRNTTLLPGRLLQEADVRFLGLEEGLTRLTKEYAR